jgi:hypothetical protein
MESFSHCQKSIGDEFVSLTSTHLNDKLQRGMTLADISRDLVAIELMKELKSKFRTAVDGYRRDFQFCPLSCQHGNDGG